MKMKKKKWWMEINLKMFVRQEGIGFVVGFECVIERRIEVVIDFECVIERRIEVVIDFECVIERKIGVVLYFEMVIERRIEVVLYFERVIERKFGVVLYFERVMYFEIVLYFERVIDFEVVIEMLKKGRRKEAKFENGSWRKEAKTEKMRLRWNWQRHGKLEEYWQRVEFLIGFHRWYL